MASRAGQGLISTSLLWLLLVSSCATVNRGTVREDDAFAALSGGGKLYFRVDVAEVRPILDALAVNTPLGLGTAKASEALDRTDSAAVALFPAGGPRRYSVAARGRYPTGRGAFSLALSSDWKKKTSASGERYWRSAGGVSLAFNHRSALVSDGEPFPGGISPSPPEAYASYGKSAALSGWISEPSSAISGFLGEAGSLIRLPIEELVFAVLKQASSDRFLLEVRLVAASPERARGLAALLWLVRGSLDAATLSGGGALLGQLLSAAPVSEGSQLILRSSPLSADEFALLCSDLSIYFSQ